MYLLDTNIVSEMRKIKNGRADAGLEYWAQNVDPINLHVSVITVLELRKGCLLKKRKDPRQGDLLLDWLENTFLPEFRCRIIPVTLGIARICADLHVPSPMPQFDSLIAATAIRHNLILVTRNTKDFSASGVRLTNPFSN